MLSAWGDSAQHHLFIVAAAEIRGGGARLWGAEPRAAWSSVSPARLHRAPLVGSYLDWFLLAVKEDERAEPTPFPASGKEARLGQTNKRGL